MDAAAIRGAFRSAALALGDSCRCRLILEDGLTRDVEKSLTLRCLTWRKCLRAQSNDVARTGGEKEEAYPWGSKIID